MRLEPRIAYFSMEIAVDASIPTYAGGLGILAGDTLRAAADLGLPMVAVTLLHRQGYFTQTIDEAGWQHEAPVLWQPEGRLRPEEPRVAVTLEGRRVALRAWRFDLTGQGGARVPVYFLDSDLPENPPEERELTHHLYGGDLRYRLCQEVILGVGGVRLLRSLGYRRLDRFHMNEGHSALLTAELIRERLEVTGKQAVDDEVIELVRRQCIFTTHTPVAAGHDKFAPDLVLQVVGRHEALEHSGLFEHDGMLNLTYAALNLSGYVNGVAKKHGDTSRHLFAAYRIDAITNGVHAASWVSPSMAEVFDRHIPDWRADSFSLRYALSIPDAEIREAHRQAKLHLLEVIRSRTGVTLAPEPLTLGFARRATGYKQADLLFSDLQRLEAVAANGGPLQLVFAGKAHPEDLVGKQIIRRVCETARRLGPGLRLVYIPDYDIELARAIVAGVDVWLNTPKRPLEASGTSGMKAALNGVPSLSILDGWWIEGCIEGVTGWAIGDEGTVERGEEARALYEKLEQVVVPAFLEPARFLNVARHAIALNGSFFNTHRMIQQYAIKAYLD